MDNNPVHSGTKFIKECTLEFDVIFHFSDFLGAKMLIFGFFGSNFSNLDIFERKNLIFSWFESAKIHILK